MKGNMVIFIFRDLGNHLSHIPTFAYPKNCMQLSDNAVLNSITLPSGGNSSGYGHLCAMYAYGMFHKCIAEVWILHLNAGVYFCNPAKFHKHFFVKFVNWPDLWKLITDENLYTGTMVNHR